MKFIEWLCGVWQSHGTKILGGLAMIVAGFPQIAGLVPEHHKPYWAAANLILGAMTVQRGVTNTRSST